MVYLNDGLIIQLLRVCGAVIRRFSDIIEFFFAVAIPVVKTGGKERSRNECGFSCLSIWYCMCVGPGSRTRRLFRKQQLIYPEVS